MIGTPETLALQLGGIGGVEWIILLAIFLIFLLGSDKMPKIMRAIGKAMGEFEKGRMEIRKELLKLQQAQMQLNPQLAPSTPAQPPTTSTEVKVIPNPEPIKPVETSGAGSGFLTKMAAELGIEVEGKSEEEVWEEVRRKVLGGGKTEAT